MILLHAFSFLVHITEVELRNGVTLISCLAVPADGLGMVLCHAFTMVVCTPKMVLSVTMPLFGGLA